MRSLPRVLGGLTAIVLVLAAWGAAHFWWGDAIVPSPWSTALLASTLLGTANFWKETGLTLGRALAGFMLALTLGVALGIVRLRFWRYTLRPAVNAVQSIPVLLWAVLLVLLLGQGNGPPVGISFLVALPLIYHSTQDGLELLNQPLLEMFRLYAPSRRLVLWELVLPLLRATLGPALSVGVTLSLKSALIGEWFGAREGLGRRIQAAWAVYAIDDFYAYTLLLVILVVGLSAASRGLARWLFPTRVPSPRAARSGACLDEAPQRDTPTGGLALRSVTFRYGAKTLFQDFDLILPPGGSLLVSGPSGCGKTTLARLLAGLIQPESGVVEAPGRRVLVFQGETLLQHRDALGNVAIPLWQLGRADWENLAAEYLRWVGLCEDDLFPDQMSGGMRKRVELARALAAEPDTLILDEALTNLHAEARRELWELIFAIHERQRFTLVAISHHPEEVAHRFGRHLRLGEPPHRSTSKA